MRSGISGCISYKTKIGLRKNIFLLFLFLKINEFREAAGICLYMRNMAVVKL